MCLLLPAVFAASVAAAPQDPAARSKEAADLMAAGRFEEAAGIYRELTAALPQDAGLKMNLGMALQQAGRPRDAIQPLTEATTADPSLTQAWLFLGAAHLELGEAARAVAALARAVQAAPDNPQARRLLADALMEANRPDAALVHYLRLTRLEPASAGGWYGLARSAESHAEDLFDILVQLPGARAAVELVGADVMAASGRTDTALEAVRAAVEAEPTWRTAHEALAELLDALGRGEEAATARARAEALPLDCQAEPAACAYREQRLGEVLRLTDPPEARRNPHALFWRLKVLDHVAGDAFERLDALPPSVEKHLAVGARHMREKKYQEAADAYRAALALKPDDLTIKVDLAFALMSLRAHDEVVELLGPAARAGTLPPRGLFAYGDALVALQRVEEALPALRKAVQDAPDQPVAHASLGRALVMAGKFEEAVPHLEAARGTDTDGSIHYQLAQAYLRVGRGDDARIALEEYRKRSQR
ncbi:MAG TPA: tetratricopeptide repeat protein [Vicinamibacterales bacterium]